MLRVLLVGCGRIGSMHYQTLQTQCAGAEVTAIVDAKLDGTFHGTPVFSPDNLATVMQSQTFDAAIIATTSSEHVAMIQRLSEYQLPIFCEKPVSFSLSDLDGLIEQGIDVQVGLNRRWDPHVCALKNALTEGEIGQPQIIRVTNRDPKRADFEFAKHSGGLLFDFSIHDFDMVNFLSQALVTEVFTQGNVLIDKQLETIGDIDTATISLKMADGSLAIIDASRETNYGYDQRIEVKGATGQLSIDNVYQKTLSTIEAGVEHQSAIEPSFVERYQMAYQAQLQGFLQGVKQNDFAVGLKEMRAALRLAIAAQASLDENRPVVL